MNFLSSSVWTAIVPILISCSSGNTGARKSVVEHVDLIELNHYYDDRGRHAFDQVIFYKWSNDYCRFHVIAWCLVEDDWEKRPTKTRSGGCQVQWFDRENQIQRGIVSKIFRETWSRVDPERSNKSLIDEKYRVSLMKLNRTIR